MKKKEKIVSLPVEAILPIPLHMIANAIASLNREEAMMFFELLLNEYKKKTSVEEYLSINDNLENIIEIFNYSKLN